jgi:hypothetical protein
VVDSSNGYGVLNCLRNLLLDIGSVAISTMLAICNVYDAIRHVRLDCKSGCIICCIQQNKPVGLEKVVIEHHGT